MLKNSNSNSLVVRQFLKKGTHDVNEDTEVVLNKALVTRAHVFNYDGVIQRRLNERRFSLRQIKAVARLKGTNRITEVVDPVLEDGLIQQTASERERNNSDVKDFDNAEEDGVNVANDLLFDELITVDQRERKKRSKKIQRTKAREPEERKVKRKRGRPKGSKNKPKVAVTPEFAWDDDDGFVLDLKTRAKETWQLGKELGLVFRGDEEVAIQGLQDQIAKNHPHLAEH